MPYSVRRVRSGKCYRVMNTQNKRVFSKCTTKARAMKQLRLLRAIQYNKSFVPNSNLLRKRSKSSKSKTRKLRK
jgi:hypothetical protein